MSLISEKPPHLSLQQDTTKAASMPRLAIPRKNLRFHVKPLLQESNPQSRDQSPLNNTVSETQLPRIGRGYDKFKARRKQSFTQDLLDVKTKHKQIIKKRTDQLRAYVTASFLSDNSTPPPEDRQSSDTVSVNVTQTEIRLPLAIEFEKNDKGDKEVSKPMRDREAKAKRIQSNLSLLKHARRISENFSQSLIHSVLYNFPRFVEAQIDESVKCATFEQLRLHRDQYLRTPLHYAAFLGQLSICKIFVDKGWVMTADVFGRSPVHYAALGNRAAVIEMILSCEQGSQVLWKPATSAPEVRLNPLETEEVTQVLEAMSRYTGQSDSTPRFNPCIPALNAPDSAGRTPLHLAVLADSYLAVQTLCMAGADPMLSDVRGNRAVDLSTTTRITQLLLKHLSLIRGKTSKVSYDVRDLELLTPLQINLAFIGPMQDTYLLSACRIGDMEAVKVLLEKGAEFTQTNKLKWTALHIVAKDNRLDMLQFIFEGKESTYKKPTLPPWTGNLWRAMEMSTKKGYNLMHICSLSSTPEVLVYICDMFIRRGKMLSSPQDLPSSCLHHTYKPFRVLLEQPCLQGFTPFLLATREKKQDIMQILVKHGCDIYKKTNVMQNALHLATLGRSRETIEYLLYLDSDYNVLKNDVDYRSRKPKDLDTTGHSYLHPWDLVKSGNVDKLFELIRAGKVDVNASTHYLKNTLLHIALQCKQIFCVRELIKLGADPKLKNAEGQSAHDVLKQLKDARYEQLATRLLAGESSLAGSELSMEQIERLYFRRNSIYSQPPKAEAPEPIQLDSELFYILKEIREVLILRKLFIADLYHLMDKNKDFSLTKGEFVSVLQWLGVEVSEENLRKLVSSLDPKSESRISYSRLVAHFQELVKRDKHYDTLNDIFEEEKMELQQEPAAQKRRNSLDFIAVGTYSSVSSASSSSDSQKSRAEHANEENKEVVVE